MSKKKWLPVLAETDLLGNDFFLQVPSLDLRFKGSNASQHVCGHAFNKATLKAKNHALQCTSAGPYNANRLPFLELAPYVVLVLIWSVCTPSALRLAIKLLHARPLLAKALRKSIRLVDTIALLSSLYIPYCLSFGP